SRYYIGSGAGGVAVGVHTTEFEIRNPKINLLGTVFKLAAEEIREAALNRPFIKVAGIVGNTKDALQDVELALKYGYDIGLLSFGGLSEFSENQLIIHAQEIAKHIPVFGFYLQPAVGGRILSHSFWQDFVEIANVQAIKIAAFNRYQTLDVVRAVCASSRRNELALYTGNDDNIVADLITPYRFQMGTEQVEKRFVGGLLGHWAVWTKKAVELLEEIKCAGQEGAAYSENLSKGIEITDMNAAIFDPAHSFHGCIPGILEVLRRQGLLEGRWCLDPGEKLSFGQAEEIDRVNQMYPHNIDDVFVKSFLEKDASRSLHIFGN
ncbi:MAG TPA: hypothetical protein VK622_08765, partial [Puia sp.]|nr:hypothetical protein [Puia sp.]